MAVKTPYMECSKRRHPVHLKYKKIENKIGKLLGGLTPLGELTVLLILLTGGEGPGCPSTKKPTPTFGRSGLAEPAP